jgi:carbonic anhydrase
MSYLEEMLEFNKKFVENKGYLPDLASKFPKKKMAILTCMDTRLIHLLLAALDLKNGDVQLVKVAGAIMRHPYGDAMRSLLVAVYELGVEDIVVIGHHDCGVRGLEASAIIEKMKERNIDQKKIDFIIRYCHVDIHKWLKGFEDVNHSVSETVAFVRHHPLIPTDVRVHGFVIDPGTGKLDHVTP